MAEKDIDKIFRMERVKSGERTVTKTVKKDKEITTIVTDQVLTVKDPKTGQERAKVVKVDRVIENGVSQWYVHKSVWQRALETCALTVVGYAAGGGLLALGGGVLGYLDKKGESLAHYKQRINAVDWQG